MIDIEGSVTITVPKRLILGVNQAINAHRKTADRKYKQACKNDKHADLIARLDSRAAEAEILSILVKEQISEVVEEVKEVAREGKPTRKERGESWEPQKN